MSGHKRMPESAAALLDELLWLSNTDTCKGRASKARADRERRIITELLQRAGETLPPEHVQEIFQGTYRCNQSERDRQQPQQPVQP
jgi:hypothetical protein